MTQSIESLQSRIAELEAENEGILKEWRVFRDDNVNLRKQLAAAQLQIKTLRDALTEITQVAAPSPVLVYQSMEIIAKQALTQPTSTEALDAYVAEKVLHLQEEHADLCRMNAEATSLAKELTRQRDLAVEALKETTVALEHRWEVIANRAAPVMESVIDAAHSKGIEALRAIKESEGK